jgi:predicted PurR-regulated permease PerM
MTEPSDSLAPPGRYTSGEATPISTSQRVSALVAVGLLALAGFWTLHLFLPALGWGGIFAVSLWPWYDRLCRAYPQQKRLLLPALTTFVVLLAFVIPLVLVISALAHDSAAVTQWVKQASAQGIAPPMILESFPYGHDLTLWWQGELGHAGGLTRLLPVHAGQGAFAWATGERFVSAIVHRLLLLVFMLLALFFVLRDGDRIARSMRIGTERALGELGLRVADQIVQAIRGTVNGLVIVGCAEGVILGVAYAATGVLHPALLGLLTGLLSAIPMGAVVAYVAAAGILAANGNIGAAIFIIILGSVVIFIADHFVRPALIGGATRLPFLWVLLGILGGIEAWGLIGLILGPALMAALLLLWREWVGALPGPLNPKRA